MRLREQIRNQFPNIKEKLLDYAPETEEELQCAFCNAYCYLSGIQCICSNKLMCLDHFNNVS